MYNVCVYNMSHITSVHKCNMQRTYVCSQQRAQITIVHVHVQTIWPMHAHTHAPLPQAATSTCESPKPNGALPGLEASILATARNHDPGSSRLYIRAATNGVALVSKHPA